MFDVANGARRVQKTQKSKLEIRKFETNSNDQRNQRIKRRQTPCLRLFRALWILFEFRFVSDFELRISNFALAPGNVIVKVLPRSRALVTVISPPWALAMARAKLRPSPVPGCDRLRSQR